MRHRGAELETLGHRLPHPRQQLRFAEQALDAQGERLVPAVRRLLQQRLQSLQSLVPRPPLQEVRHAAQSLEACGERLLPAVTRLLSAKQEVMESSARLLSSLSYKQTLARGYAVVRGPEGVLQRAQEVGPGATLRLEFFDGEVDAVVQTESSSKPRPAPRPEAGRAASLIHPSRGASRPPDVLPIDSPRPRAVFTI